MTIVAVSDTNIFIDLLETSLLEKLFHLPWEIHTTDFILNEIKEAHQKKQMNTIRSQMLNQRLPTQELDKRILQWRQI